MNNNKQKSENLDEPLISILVLNYNGIKFLKDCYESLLQSRYKHFEIVLIDNNSSDDSVQFTESQYPMVKIIQTGENAGYSRAYNIAFTKALGKYFILLNNDVVVDKGWLGPLVNAAEKDETIGALQPKIRSMIDDGYFEYAGACGGYMDRYGYPFLRGRIFYTIEKDDGQYNDKVNVFWTSGAAMFLRASALKKSGNLDEDFVHHMEEIDLCWRLHLVGYKLSVIPDSVIYHYAGATIKPDSFKKLYWNHRNGIITLLKNVGPENLFRVFLVRYILDLINIFFAGIIQFDFKHSYSILKSHIWIMFNLRMILRKRREVQAIRVVGDETFQEYIYPGSVVLAYFLRRQKVFSGLKFDK